MDLTSLAIFRAVALEQSVTRAAQNLQRAQSNVTTRIQQLEQELDTSLFLREGKRMRLTEQGRAFLAYAEQLLALADEARQALHPQQPAGTLRLGSMESSAATRLPTPLAGFHCSHPQVDLQVHTGTSQALLTGVLERRLDCALIASPGRLEHGRWTSEALDEGLQGEALFREELLLLLPADHPPVTSPADVQPRTLAGFALGCSYRQLGEAWLRQSGAPLRVQEVGSYHAILACVAAGACVGVVPRALLELQRQPPALRQVPLAEVDTLLVWRHGYRAPAFLAWQERLRAAT